MPVAFGLLFGSRRMAARASERTKKAAVRVSDGIQEALENVREIRATNQDVYKRQHLYLAIDGQLAAVICIADPQREEAQDVLAALRRLGIQKVVMLTGDSRRTAEAVASRIGIDEFCAEVLPEDKANYVAALRAQGHTVIMVGDGINDSPALSEADAGIAVSDGAAIAQEIADVTIAAESLWELVRLRQLAMALNSRIRNICLLYTSVVFSLKGSMSVSDF